MANFVESEQVVVLEDKQGNLTTSSFVQIRGSIPLLWSQIPNIKYKPPTRIAPPSASHPAFDHHFKQLLDTYQVFCRSLSVCLCVGNPVCLPVLFFPQYTLACRALNTPPFAAELYAAARLHSAVY